MFSQIGGVSDIDFAMLFGMEYVNGKHGFGIKNKAGQKVDWLAVVGGTLQVSNFVEDYEAILNAKNLLG